MDAALSLHSLAVGYAGRTVVADVDLDVAAGEFVSILGPSGCGKTTVLRAIAGFLPAARGRIVLGGVDITDRPPERRDVGIIFQNYALFPTMTAFENIAFGLRVARRPERDIRAEVHRIAEVAGIADHLAAKPAELSGGQQQRVAIARALVMGDRVLLLDEPLSNLDATVRQTMRREIKRLQRALGFTALFVTHDQEEALSLSDRIVVMRGGAIAQVGSGRDLYHRPASDFVCTFLGSANALGPHLAARLVGRPVAGRCYVRPEDVLLGPAHSDGAAATVAAVEFLGASSRVDLLCDGEPLFALAHHGEPPAVGAVVTLRLRDGRAHIFAETAP